MGAEGFQSNDDFREEIGWEELVQTIAGIRDSLSNDEKASVGILAGNYGEAGAVNLYGPRYDLPTVICGTNSFWERGYGNKPPQTIIAVGLSREYLAEHFESCELAGQIMNRQNVRNEETTEHREIFICSGLRGTWAEFWKSFQHYG